MPPKSTAFSNKRQDPTLVKETWFKQAEVETVADIPPVFPIPAHLVYDLFNQEMDAMVLYERFMVALDLLLPQTFPNTRYLLRNFTKAQVVTPTKKSPQTKLDPTIFLDSLPPQANQWKSTVISQFLPDINLHQSTSTPTNTHPSSNTSTPSYPQSATTTPSPSTHTSTSTNTPVTTQIQTPTPTPTTVNNNNNNNNSTNRPNSPTSEPQTEPAVIAEALNRLTIDPPIPTVHIPHMAPNVLQTQHSPLPSASTTPQPNVNPTTNNGQN